MRPAAALAATLALTACAGYEVRPLTDADLQFLYWDTIVADTRREYATQFQDKPFEDGPIAVIASEHGQLRTWTLAPCGSTVCAGGPHGARGRLELTPDYWIVSGLYGRTFILSPGGNGGLRRPGHPDVQLAWETIEPIVSPVIPNTTFEPVPN